MQPHGDGTVTLSLGLFAAEGLFLWSNLLFHTNTQRERQPEEACGGLAGDATVCTVPSLGQGASSKSQGLSHFLIPAKRAERVQRVCVRV